MPKVITLGNGNMLAGLDHRGAVRDLYYPYAGQENHISGASGSYQHRIGVFADGMMHWLDDPAWHVDVACRNETAASHICAQNEVLGVSLSITDIIYNERDVFIRNVEVTNERDEEREIKIFFSQQFRISESRRGATGFYDPRVHAIIHYRGERAFLVNAFIEDEAFDDYTVGLFGIEGREGSHTDAEDGVLSKNPIEHGSVDSVIGLTHKAAPKEKAMVNYWIVANNTIDGLHDLNDFVYEETPARLMKSTQDYWHAWVNKERISFYDLDESTIDLFKKSLLIIRAHTDNGGAIIASSDSDILQNGRDTYSYMWPRDAAIVAHALDRAGYVDPARRFYALANEVLNKEGYFMHKYLPDGSLGSSWHPWMRDGKMELPIQEDETALVLFMLRKHYDEAKDLEFIESVYNPFIEKAASFMCEHVHADSGLPKETYDLWEEKYGTSTYTSSAVYGALIAAADFALMLGKRADAERYRKTAQKISKAIVKHMYDEKLGMFVKLCRHTDDGIEYDRTVDISSFHGIVFFGVLPINDHRVKKSLETVMERLHVETDVGGIMRYEGDNYYRLSHDAPPNPWFVTSLWLAQYHIKAAEKEEDLKIVKEWLSWVNAHAAKTGVLSEQLNPYTGEHLSVAPLTWSHAEFIITVLEYLYKIEEFGIATVKEEQI